MTEPAIPTSAQIRAMPVTTVKAFTEALRDAGLTVKNGGTHLRVETATGRLLCGLPLTPSDSRSLLNGRASLARRLAEIDTQPERRSG